MCWSQTIHTGIYNFTQVPAKTCGVQDINQRLHYKPKETREKGRGRREIEVSDGSGKEVNIY